MNKKIEITKSRALKTDLGGFQNVDFFVSAKVEVDDTEEAIAEASQRLADYCKGQIVKDMNSELASWAKQVSAENKKKLLETEI